MVRVRQSSSCFWVTLRWKFLNIPASSQLPQMSAKPCLVWEKICPEWNFCPALKGKRPLLCVSEGSWAQGFPGPSQWQTGLPFTPPPKAVDISLAPEEEERTESFLLVPQWLKGFSFVWNNGLGKWQSHSCVPLRMELSVLNLSNSTQLMKEYMSETCSGSDVKMSYQLTFRI